MSENLKLLQPNSYVGALEIQAGKIQNGEKNENRQEEANLDLLTYPIPPGIQNTEILICQSENGNAKVEVCMEAAMSEAAAVKEYLTVRQEWNMLQ